MGSVTEWVLCKYNSEEEGLQESKNFVFIWNLFENQSKDIIFTSDLKLVEFKNWVKSLIVRRDIIGICICEATTGNSISGNLLNNIDKAFNHFFQLYKKDSNKFLDTLFNQTDGITQNSKARFQQFSESLNISDIKDKIVFLFMIAKRMRNKFFHGIKSIGDIKSDQKHFKKINEYLIAIISLIEEYS